MHGATEVQRGCLLRKHVHIRRHDNPLAVVIELSACTILLAHHTVPLRKQFLVHLVIGQVLVQGLRLLEAQEKNSVHLHPIQIILEAERVQGVLFELEQLERIDNVLVNPLLIHIL